MNCLVSVEKLKSVGSACFILYCKAIKVCSPTFFIEMAKYVKISTQKVKELLFEFTLFLPFLVTAKAINTQFFQLS